MYTEEQKQLIGKMQMLKEIKPRKEWAVLLKHQILTEPVSAVNFSVSKKVGIMETLTSLFFQRKLAYSFATLLLVMAGLAGFAGQTMPGEQTASLSIQTTTVKQSVSAINSKIRDLAEVLANTPKQDSQTIKGIVDSLKTLASVQSDFNESKDVKDLYETLVLGQIYDLQHSTLTKEQEVSLLEIEKLADDRKYMEALEKILMIK